MSFKEIVSKASKLLTHHKVAALVVVFIVFLVCSIGFVSLADEVTEGETKRFDESVLTSINSYASPGWDAFFVSFTQLGGLIAVIAITAGLVLLLVNRHKYKSALIVGGSVAGAALLNLTLKFIFERARPDLWQQLVVETSYSFPSGHAMISAALGMSIIVIFWKTRYRYAALVGGIVYILLISFSRLYLGVHYPTDIIAGWLVSAAWVVVVTAVVNYKYLRRSKTSV